jgi:hypothetical protein
LGDDRAAEGAEKASLILAHTRADVRDLNERARDILKERNELGRRSQSASNGSYWPPMARSPWNAASEAWLRASG